MKRVIIVTGASDGIGAELVRQLAQTASAQRPLALVLAARSHDALEALAQAVRSPWVEVQVQVTDVRMQQQCRALVESAEVRWGRLDVLVNNAGVSAHAFLSEVTAEHLGWYQEVMAVNFWGTVWCTHAALPALRRSRGQVVAVSSLAGLVGVPGRTAYSASKFAMGGFMEALRAEEAPHGIGVTVAYPGVVDTRIRLRGYNAQGQAAGRSGLDEQGAMSVHTCAALILRGMERRQREVVMTLQGRLGRWLKLLAPGLVDRMAWRALQRSDRSAAEG